MDDPGPQSIITDPTNILIGFAGIMLLLGCSALISGTEVALFSLTPDDVDKIKRKDTQKGNLIAGLLQKPKKLLATIVITNTFINIAIILFFFRLNAFAGITPSGLRFAVQVAVITILILLFGEVLPKVYAGRNNQSFASRVAYPLLLLSKALSPFSIPMRNVTLWLQKKFGDSKSTLSVDRLSQALELTDYGKANEDEQKILEGIVNFGSTDARQVMTPRIDIFALKHTAGWEEVLESIRENGYSRIPVYEGTIDRITGILYIKDLIPYIGSQNFAWQDIVRNPYFIPETIKLDDLLRDFQDMKNHLAVVVNEYGDTSGIITLEDILEEIVGDISDEFDDDALFFTQIDELNFLFDGKIGLKDFYRITGTDEDDFEDAAGDADTLGGFVTGINGNFPEKGQKINFKGNIFTVESVDKRRIKQIKVTLNEALQ
ncbi:hemolysin [Flavobacterium akiainvivens]|uniref:Hemolysin n=1 Tax=Flavobacterium akiainvivens TaxID=1202724 RepID=A0A0M9VII3_9FLAO|nr:gliding motility-associated protein GldE [Flavobacterium akiainvivens]KOS06662.1 hemolysin [Flavobacterium akiainvivens]SFQ70594.1 protein involved in gliding motility GldE [Flavobacterium akiainvivens]